VAKRTSIKLKTGTSSRWEDFSFFINAAGGILGGPELKNIR